ncbi:MAG: RecX family transcriptional regulator [Bacteroidales bacterium]|nr:RecX family transcriptional regulator [Bacteroidales bacterium]
MTEETAKTLSKLMVLCSRAEKCESEAYKYMTTRGATNEEAFEAVEYLTANQYVDNERYARSYVADKARFNKWGKDKIVMQLRIKQIPDSVINGAIEEIFDPELEKNTISTELAKKLRGLKDDEPRAKAWEKLMRFAAGRGYPAATCGPIITKMLNDRQNNN